MNNLTPQQTAKNHLEYLCQTLPTRRVGSAGNRLATAFFAEQVSRFGFEVTTPTFDCIDWQENGAQLSVADNTFEVQVSPYTLGCDVNALLVSAGSVADLTAVDASGKVLLLHGDFAGEQLMPKNFPFYNPTHHQQIIALLESKAPQAIIAATTQDVGLAGALSPFPLIEDGDFDIPSVFMSAEEGARLLQYVGQSAQLRIQAKRQPATGYNVNARKGDASAGRVIVCAHIDAKDGTPGAIDNGTGVVILLLLAELLADYQGQPGIEIIAINGEDYYDASGEKLFVAANAGKFDEIMLAINMDGVGYREGQTAWSFYDCPANIETTAREIFATYPSMTAGKAWYQSDHSIFIMNQRPAIAFTSDAFDALWTNIAHTPLDVPAIIDYAKLVETAAALNKLLNAITL